MINRALAKKLMNEEGWTCEALAVAVGMSVGNLYRILGGQQEPRVSIAMALAKCLKVRVEELFSDPDNRTQTFFANSRVGIGFQCTAAITASTKEPEFLTQRRRKMKALNISKFFSSSVSLIFLLLIAANALAQTPSVNSITPNLGSTLGGTAVTITGQSFLPGAKATIGGVDAKAVFVSSTTLRGTTGSHIPGIADLVVTNPNGQSATLAVAFTYVAPFQDVTVAAGVEFQHTRDKLALPLGGGVAVGDYNNDGFLDIFVTNSAGLNALYRNNGDGTFTDVAAAAGVADSASCSHNGAAFADYDNDGNLDLFVTGYGCSKLYHNNGNGTFTDVSAVSGAGVRMFGMCLGVGDYNNDGFLDFFMSNMGNSVLLANNGDGTFTDKTAAAGVGAGTAGGLLAVGWGCSFFDYDNDGNEDLYVVRGFLDSDPGINAEQQPNVLFANKGDGTFTDISNLSGADDNGIGRGGVYLDFNNDSFLDLYVVNIGKLDGTKGKAKLFRNIGKDLGNTNNWLVIKTVGTVSNKNGIGARIKVITGTRTRIREIRSGSSHMSQDMLWAHFGLGTVTKADTVEIRWPSGKVQTLTNVAANQFLTVTEPR